MKRIRKTRATAILCAAILMIPGGAAMAEQGEQGAPGQQEQAVEMRDTYVLPESSERLMSAADVRPLSREELRLALNEIYARHGRSFTDPQLQAYFNTCSWYTPTVSAEDFNEGVLSDIERRNIDYFLDYQGQFGMINQWVFHDSDSRLIGREEAEALDDTYLDYAINEILARHGRIFSRQPLQSYFESCLWYSGTQTSDTFKELEELNVTERTNVAMMRDVRQKRQEKREAEAASRAAEEAAAQTAPAVPAVPAAPAQPVPQVPVATPVQPAQTTPAVPAAPAAPHGIHPVPAGGYILPQSSTALLTAADLAALTPEELRLARNEIFARHGRKFASQDLQAYFNTCPWYAPVYEADAFPYALLSEVENKNITAIVGWESGNYTLPSVQGNAYSAYRQGLVQNASGINDFSSLLLMGEPAANNKTVFVSDIFSDETPELGFLTQAVGTSEHAAPVLNLYGYVNGQAVPLYQTALPVGMDGKCEYAVFYRGGYLIAYSGYRDNGWADHFLWMGTKADGSVGEIATMHKWISQQTGTATYSISGQVVDAATYEGYRSVMPGGVSHSFLWNHQAFIHEEDWYPLYTVLPVEGYTLDEAYQLLGSGNVTPSAPLAMAAPYMYINCEESDRNGNGVLDYQVTIRDAGSLIIKDAAEAAWREGAASYGKGYALWNSPWGLCIYAKGQNGGEGSSYILDEHACAVIANSFGILESQIPSNDREQ